MHDWVRLDSALFRLNHYQLRSREWLLKVKGCRSRNLSREPPKSGEADDLVQVLADLDAKAKASRTSLVALQSSWRAS